jgi:hypothetical protein
MQVLGSAEVVADLETMDRQACTLVKNGTLARLGGDGLHDFYEDPF